MNCGRPVCLGACTSKALPLKHCSKHTVYFINRGKAKRQKPERRAVGAVLCSKLSNAARAFLPPPASKGLSH